MNLPNAITVARIAATPLIAALALVPSWPVRLIAFLLFVAAAVTDYYDGMLARTRGLVTDLGKILDPLADKLLLAATLLPMYWLMRPRSLYTVVTPYDRVDGLPFLLPHSAGAVAVGLPLWVVLVVLGRELFMTIFRQVAARRGVVIAAIGPAKWKTGFQSVWVGSAFFWFWYYTGVKDGGFAMRLPGSFALYFGFFNGIVGVVTMIVAVALTVYSLGLYVRRYGWLLAGRRAPAAAK